ncbi:MAG: alpha-L-rhamnosidase C-terminal domain-containing protein [Bacteroidota bacterium]|nr:alpha-L-rhamnosidase C-terminal domain-containing protein [Bacteroidota bacterium]
MKKLLFILFAILQGNLILGQNIDQSILTKTWRATWVSYPEESDNDFAVYHFRKVLTLSEKPLTYVIHVSADNHYKLYVNGVLVSVGPASGDLNNWKYETVDIAPYLQTGNNVVLATVWNEGKYRAITQFSNTTAFILQGNTTKEYELNTNKDWLCIKDTAYKPVAQKPVGYFAADPGILVNMNLTSDECLKPEFECKNWKSAQYVSPAIPKGIHSMFYSPWMLVPSGLPQQERTVMRLVKTPRVDGISVPAAFPSVKSSLNIPANSKVSILLDQTFLTNAYPTLIYSKGKNTRIALQYAEGLFNDQFAKLNRNNIEGKKIIGRTDSLICNGMQNQTFTTLKWRTYRYLQLDIQTANEPLVINDIYGTFTGYPFKNNTTFSSEKPLLDSILQIGWRTARLCAVETYFDCPYYEQLQYIGDTRIQMMVSYYNSGDDRLAKNAINLIDASRLPEGITQSRYPSSKVQIIPPFSLLWIGMLSDYYRYCTDSNFVKSKLAGVRQVLSFFANYQQEDGTLKNVPYWNFTDWATGLSKGWKFGIAPVSKNGASSVQDLQLLRAFQLASELEYNLGNKAFAAEYKTKAAQLQQTILKKYWNVDKKLFADNEDMETYSQHANVLAILTGTITGEDSKGVFQRIINNSDIAQASIYFKYYMNQAMVKVGLGDDYLNHLDIWKKNIQLGMTTWGEDSNVETTRSDCHAWGASPNIELFRTVLGIESDAPGFAKVKIEPHLGDLKKVSGSMPHPKGAIKVAYSCNKKNKWIISVNLPEGISGNFIWKGKIFSLKSGNNQLEL